MKEKVIGVYPLSNFGGIEILESNDATVKWRYNFGEPQEAQESIIIEYYFEGKEGEAVSGFSANGTFIDFSEILRL